MSFMGFNSIPNNDRTEQHTGSPALSRHMSHEVEEPAPPAAHGETQTQTRATSMTETGGGPGEASAEKPGTPPGAKTDGNTDSEEERRNSMVQDLARRYTSHQSASGGGNPFLAGEDSHLNPNSPHFSGRAWAKSIVDLVAEEGHAFRTSGVAFQNLNVFGFGQATDYQKDVFNVWLSAAGVVRNLLGYGKRRIDILRDFDGVVNKGEMLVVLGPPGAGCSTFLKTLAGETSGLYVDDKSYFNYQGKFSVGRSWFEPL